MYVIVTWLIILFPLFSLSNQADSLPEKKKKINIGFNFSQAFQSVNPTTTKYIDRGVLLLKFPTTHCNVRIQPSLIYYHYFIKGKESFANNQYFYEDYHFKEYSTGIYSGIERGFEISDRVIFLTTADILTACYTIKKYGDFESYRLLSDGSKEISETKTKLISGFKGYRLGIRPGLGFLFKINSHIYFSYQLYINIFHDHVNTKGQILVVNNQNYLFQSKKDISTAFGNLYIHFVF